jgi:GNAT superfamily N-acetyltransferase
VLSEISIRGAVSSDLPGILRLYSQPGMNEGRVLSIDAATNIFQRMSTYPYYSVYVATDPAGAILGTFALLIMDNLAHMGAPIALVEAVCVEEQLRGQGIGSMMMSHAMHVARTFGCYKLTLSSNLVRSKAHDFYRSLGFEQHGVSFHVRLSEDAAVDT